MPVYIVQVDSNGGFIRILRQGWPTTPAHEMLYWDRQEWIDDPDVVFAIANACALTANPEAMDKKLWEMGKLRKAGLYLVPINAQ